MAHTNTIKARNEFDVFVREMRVILRQYADAFETIGQANVAMNLNYIANELSIQSDNLFNAVSEDLSTEVHEGYELTASILSSLIDGPKK